MLVDLVRDEAYPLKPFGYSSEQRVYGALCEVPEDVINRYSIAVREFNAVQRILELYYYKEHDEG